MVRGAGPENGGWGVEGAGGYTPSPAAGRAAWAGHLTSGPLIFNQWVTSAQTLMGQGFARGRETSTVRLARAGLG